MLEYYEKKVKKWRRAGSDFRGACPLHNGSNDQAFAVNPATWVWFCHVCNEGGDAIDLERKLSGCSYVDAARIVGVKPKDYKGTGERMSTQITAPTTIEDVHYDYRDEEGVLLFQVVRKHPKTFRQRRYVEGKWEHKLGDVRRVIYRLPEILARPDEVVWFVEGEKDADRLATLGLLATTNSGGAKKLTRSAATSLTGRTIALCPDQDDVGLESAAYVKNMLISVGCVVNQVDLAGVKDVSDWLDQGHTKDELIEIYNAAVPGNHSIPNSEPGWPQNVDEMLETYIVVRGTDNVFCRRTARTVKPTALKLSHGATLYKNWSESKRLKTVDLDRIVFSPGGCRDGELNLFTGLPDLDMSDAGDDIYTWCAHLEKMVGTGDPWHWFMSRLAFKLRNLGVKVGSSVVLHGKPGSGKNLTFAPLMAIYGKYAREVGQQQVDSPYTGWLSSALMIVADEVNINQNKTLNRFKSIITSGDIAIEEKYQPVRFERNYADIHFLSNEATPIALEADDRRYFVAKTSYIGDRDYYRRLAAVNPASVKKYLLEYDCAGFDPKSAPPMTDAKRALISSTRCSAEQFLHEWLEDELRVPVGPVAASELYRAYTVWLKTRGEKTAQPERIFRVKATMFLGQTLVAKETNKAIRYYQPAGFSDKQNIVYFKTALEKWIVDEQKVKL
jgi:hypothetical protein